MSKISDFESLIDEVIESNNQSKENTSDYPEWSNFDPVALDCYKAIRQLMLEKEYAIRDTKSSSDFAKKKSYQISKSQVGERVGKTAQYLFSVSAFARSAADEFDKANKTLVAKKERRLKTFNSSHAAMRKGDLLGVVKSDKKTIELLEQKLATQSVRTILEMLPDNLKKDMGLL